MRHAAAKGFLLALTGLLATSGAPQQVASATEAKTVPAKGKGLRLRRSWYSAHSGLRRHRWERGNNWR